MFKLIKIILLYTTTTLQMENFDEINNLLNFEINSKLKIPLKLKTIESYELSKNLFLKTRKEKILKNENKIRKIQNFELFNYVTRKDTMRVQNTIFLILNQNSILIRSENLEILIKVDLEHKNNNIDCIEFSKKDIFCVEYNNSFFKIHKFFLNIPLPYGRKIRVTKKMLKKFEKKNFQDFLKKISTNEKNNFEDLEISNMYLLGIDFDINLFFTTKKKEYHLYSLLKNAFLIETDSLNFKNLIRSKKHLIICYEEKIKIFNPVGTLLKKQDFENGIENCKFNYDKFVSLFILFKNGTFSKIFLTSILKEHFKGNLKKGEIFFNDKLTFEKNEKSLKINFKKRNKSEIFDFDYVISNLFIIDKITTNQFFILFENENFIELFSYQKGEFKGTIYKEESKNYKIPSLFLILGFVVCYNLFCRGKVKDMKQRKRNIQNETRKKLGKFSRKYKD